MLILSKDFLLPYYDLSQKNIILSNYSDLDLDFLTTNKEMRRCANICQLIRRKDEMWSMTSDDKKIYEQV